MHQLKVILRDFNELEEKEKEKKTKKSKRNIVGGLEASKLFFKANRGDCLVLLIL